MKNLSLLFSLFIFTTSPTYSQDTINVPADYTTIQAAIDAAVNGNIVLVSDGTYIENINFSGKAITVASHFIRDYDSLHIQNTIIKGSNPTNPNQASVVNFYWGEDTTSVLRGFTITGGLGRIWYGTFLVGGGLYIENSSPLIKENIIELNELNSGDKGVFGSAIFIETGSAIPIA